MNDFELRVARLEGALEVLRDEMARVDARINKNKTQEGRYDKFLRTVNAFSAIIAGTLVACVAYFLTDSVNHALQQHQIEVASGQAMQILTATLRDSHVEKPAAEAAALSLASAFGNDAAITLIMELEDGNEITIPAAEKALRALGLKNPAPTCELVAKVVLNNSRLFSLRTHETAIRLLGDLGCPNAAQTLHQYRTFLASVAARNLQNPIDEYSKVFGSEPAIDQGGIRDLTNTLDNELTLIQAQTAR
jgi:hypothetical protein